MPNKREHSVLYGDVAEAAIETVARFKTAREGLDLVLSDGTELTEEVRERIVEVQQMLTLPKRSKAVANDQPSAQKSS